MFSADQYRLLDFGDQRKLERIGPWVIDRPSPAATGSRRQSQIWSQADARFDRPPRADGKWNWRREPPADWTVTWGAIRLQLQPTPFGHVGLFPEQARIWEWLAQQVRAAGRPLKVLHLFAYTGGATLAAAAAGASVTHVDAARNIITRARRNAELSELGAAPIRWIAEDAMKFTSREGKRDRRYDALILDPPSFGHGPKRTDWRIDRDLPQLLEQCSALVGDRCAFAALSSHSPGWTGRRLARELSAALSASGSRGAAHHEPLTLRDAAGRSLDCGAAALWSAQAVADSER